MRRMLSVVLGVSAALGQSGAVGAQDVRNEGTGERRAALDAMVYNPAPMDSILSGTEWIGSAPTAAELNGKVVMVVTWAEWYRPSHAAVMLAQRLLAQHGADGFVVIGVHDKDGWESASAFASARKLGFPTVRDTAGDVRRAFMVDQDPDIYVIDRAGNMRYADITTETAGVAVDSLVNEDQAGAAAAQALLEQQRARQRAESRRSGAINQSVTLENPPAVPFTKPTAEEYAATNWPKIDEELLRSASSIDELTPPFAVPEGEWLNGKPSTEGKIIVAYIWHPVQRVMADELMRKMEGYHKQQGRDIAVMGFLTPFTDQNRSRSDSGLIVDSVRDLPITMQGLQTALGGRRFTHSMMPFPGGNPLPQPSSRGRTNNSENMIGQVIVVSTDGRVRRLAHATRWSEVQQAVDHLLRVDPGVKARREAESRYIRGNGG